jgi:hypothetical protein
MRPVSDGEPSRELVNLCGCMVYLYQCVQMSTWCSLWLYIEEMLSVESARRVQKDGQTT